jgi:hypothetical protein
MTPLLLCQPRCPHPLLLVLQLLGHLTLLSKIFYNVSKFPFTSLIAVTRVFALHTRNSKHIRMLLENLSRWLPMGPGRARGLLQLTSLKFSSQRPSSLPITGDVFQELLSILRWSCGWIRKKRLPVTWKYGEFKRLIIFFLIFKYFWTMEAPLWLSLVPLLRGKGRLRWLKGGKRMGKGRLRMRGLRKRSRKNQMG